MVKVLHICAALDAGGVEKFIYNYYKKIDRLHIQFDFVVHSVDKGMLENKIIHMGAEVYHVVPKTKNLIKYCKDLNKILCYENYDIVHCHQGYNSFVPLVIAWKCRIKTRISHAHTAFEKSNVRNIIKRKLMTVLTKLIATDLFACGETASKWMWGNSKVEIIRNAIDIESFYFETKCRDRIRDQMEIKDNFVIGCFARIEESKNFPMLLAIYKEIKLLNKNAQLLIAGSGKEEDNIKCMAEKMQLDNIIFVGIRSDIAELMNAIDVFVLPTFFEGFGISFMEAQVNGVRTFASEGVVPAEVRITDRMEFISLKKTPKEWADIIVSQKDYTHIDTSDNKEISKYNINEAAAELSKIYQSMKKI